MQLIKDLFSVNEILTVSLLGWFVAQVLKTIIYALMHHTLDARTVTVEVLAVAEAVRKDDAAAMYREI